MKSEKISFCTPLKNEKSVSKSLENICKKYIQMLQSFKDRDLIRYSEYSDYSFLK